MSSNNQKEQTRQKKLKYIKELEKNEREFMRKHNSTLSNTVPE